MAVKIWAEKVMIPTYAVGERDKNPMFLEKRVYQGSSGRVYPWPVIDKIEDEKKDKEYLIVFLENEYIQVQVMPEIGGRIYRALDKTNQYDFVYYNRVMKPALVGLTGPWVSGGIEFNWPQHHRPNTYGEVSYRIDDADENCKTVWLSEQDRMYGTKVTTGISVREGVASIEIKSELYNPTGQAQTFLWWANPAVAVHDETQSIFPPDVTAVMDHGKRDVSRFPIATGTYYKMDYSKGVDISRYKNIPVPTSYMAYHSDFDFVGGYDYRADAGILHVADHHISPGKKQWTWGCGEFGKAWDRNLTDEDGPYIELMTGVFTDNQPDFTWLAPYSGKNFTQYFMPYKTVGEVKCANKDIVAGLSADGEKITLRVYASKKLAGAKIRLTADEEILLETEADISPVTVFEWEKESGIQEWKLKLTVIADKAETLTYAPEKPEIKKMPDAAKAIGLPETLASTEALWLAGLHLEQYRHATYEPEGYYLEGLKRDKGDIRLNNAYGNLLLKRGQFAEAQKCFETAVETATRHSPNPYDGEVFYNLGKALEMQGKDDEAFDAYFKSVWSDAWRSQGYLKLAQIAARNGRWEEALSHAKESLWANYKNFSARAAVAVLERLCGHPEEAKRIYTETQQFDSMDFVAAYERFVLENSEEAEEKLNAVLNQNAHNAMALAEAYKELGEYQTAADILNRHIQNGGESYAMVYYDLADCLANQHDQGAEAAWKAAADYSVDYCFPNMLSEYRVLNTAIEKNPQDFAALYYLGCFLYDKKRYADAKEMWEKSAKLRPQFASTHRNLALYYANKEHDYVTAKKELETAFSLNSQDARLFYELCELYKKIGMTAQEQYEVFASHQELVRQRDDLSVGYAEVLNALEKYDESLALLMNRKFHPWEGGEGKVPAQHIEARIGLAKRLMQEGNYAEAIAHLEKATVYYENFGEGKLMGAQENHIYYTMGLAYQAIDVDKAKLCFEKASQGLSEPAGAMYYNDQPPQMIYYQGMALLALGRTDEANTRFNKLLSYGEKHLFEKQVMDYFAVSLPDFLVFETDLDEKNRVHCHYMMALGLMGLGRKEEAEKSFNEALKIMPCHYGVAAHKKLLFQ